MLGARVYVSAPTTKDMTPVDKSYKENKGVITVKYETFKDFLTNKTTIGYSSITAPM
jgi:hypothetical protein